VVRAESFDRAALSQGGQGRQPEGLSIMLRI
jgi:hypothetical protein